MKVSDGTFYSPIKIIGNNALNYEAVQDFMMSKKAVKTINSNVAESALKKIPNTVEMNEGDVVNGKVCAYVMQSHTIYSGIRSAVAYLYRRVGLPMPTEMTRKFKEYISGQKRTGLKEKQDLGLEIKEGKKHFHLMHLS